MRTPVLALGPALTALCLACRVALAAPGEAAPRAAQLVPLPPAQVALELQAAPARGDEAGPSLLDLLVRLGDSSGAVFTMSADVRHALAQTSPGLTRGVQVAPKDAWTWVESLLHRAGFALSLQTREAPHLVAVLSSGVPQQPVVPAPQLLEVPAERVEELAAHPALLVRTLVHLEHTDARHVGNSLRGLLGGTLTSVVPMGTGNTMLLTGQAAYVVDLVRILRQLDAASAAEWERAAQEPGDGEAPRER